jgi:hypothetical protein
MATRPIVPRANGEGSLGVTSKYWGNTFTQKLNGANAVDMTDFSTATLRQPSTAQSVGDIRYHATLPAGWYLECTTAGTTGSGDLTISSPSIGGTVTDGTVTWTVNRDLALIGGGALTGSNLTWNANDLGGSAIVAKSLGENGYIKYASGLILQWGVTITNGTSPMQVSLPVGFPNGASIIMVSEANSTQSSSNYGVSNPLATQYSFSLYFPTAGVRVCWFAIGY